MQLMHAIDWQYFLIKLLIVVCPFLSKQCDFGSFSKDSFVSLTRAVLSQGLFCCHIASSLCIFLVLEWKRSNFITCLAVPLSLNVNCKILSTSSIGVLFKDLLTPRLSLYNVGINVEGFGWIRICYFKAWGGGGGQRNHLPTLQNRMS